MVWRLCWAVLRLKDDFLPVLVSQTPSRPHAYRRSDANHGRLKPRHNVLDDRGIATSIFGRRGRNADEGDIATVDFRPGTEAFRLVIYGSGRKHPSDPS